MFLRSGAVPHSAGGTARVGCPGRMRLQRGAGAGGAAGLSSWGEVQECPAQDGDEEVLPWGCLSPQLPHTHTLEQLSPAQMCLEQQLLYWCLVFILLCQTPLP